MTQAKEILSKLDQKANEAKSKASKANEADDVTKTVNALKTASKLLRTVPQEKVASKIPPSEIMYITNFIESFWGFDY